MFFMLMDHTWATFLMDAKWMTYLGRIAFPIFAFQIVEGYLHTSNIKKYKKRLFIFALISEIPFNLLQISSIIDPFDQNVIWTFLFSIMSIDAINNIKKYIYDKKHNEIKPKKKILVKSIFTILGFTLLSMITFCDYRFFGYCIVLTFYVLRHIKISWLENILQLIIIFILSQYLFVGEYIPVNLFRIDIELQIQTFAILALPFIWLYNGEKKISSKGFQYFGYIFYPAHMLILYLCKYFI